MHNFAFCLVICDIFKDLVLTFLAASFNPFHSVDCCCILNPELLEKHINSKCLVLAEFLQVLVIAVLLKIIMRRRFSIIQVSLVLRWVLFTYLLSWLAKRMKRKNGPVFLDENLDVICGVDIYQGLLWETCNGLSYSDIC